MLREKTLPTAKGSRPPKTHSEPLAVARFSQNEGVRGEAAHAVQERRMLSLARRGETLRADRQTFDQTKRQLGVAVTGEMPVPWPPVVEPADSTGVGKAPIEQLEMKVLLSTRIA